MQLRQRGEQSNESLGMKSESVSGFKARIAAIMRAQGKVIATDRPCVRTPEDRGYYPTTRKIYDSTNSNDNSDGGDGRNNRGSDV
jgi:hypothetical protein